MQFMATRVVDCPLGEQFQRYWNRLSDAETQMQMDVPGLYSLTVQESARQMARLVEGTNVIDAFCGVGGNAIAYALEGRLVRAFELDPKRLEMAKANAELFGVSARIRFDLGDARDLLSNTHADVVFLDMPWGGVDYYKKPSFRLEDFAPSGSEMLSKALRAADVVVMKLPKNFDATGLESLGVDFATTDDILRGELVGRVAVIRRGTWGLCPPR